MFERSQVKWVTESTNGCSKTSKWVTTSTKWVPLKLQNGLRQLYAHVCHQQQVLTEFKSISPCQCAENVLQRCWKADHQCWTNQRVKTTTDGFCMSKYHLCRWLRQKKKQNLWDKINLVCLFEKRIEGGNKGQLEWKWNLGHERASSPLAKGHIHLPVLHSQ